MKKTNFLLSLLMFSLAFLHSCSANLTSGFDKINRNEAISVPPMPLLTEKSNVLGEVAFLQEEPFTTDVILISLESQLKSFGLSEVSIYVKNGEEKILFGSSTEISKQIIIKGNASLQGNVHLLVEAKTTASPDLLNRLKIKKLQLLATPEKKFLEFLAGDFPAQRFGISVRTRKQDGVDCYRIPGMATTNKGTLIAVYDNRYNNCKDLQEDINVGMSRSTDGGQTWEPMKVIMDLKTWGGLPEELNGIGDPAVLVDKNTGTIWVAALWLHGRSKQEMAWWASKPGMTEQETGQLMLVKSEDDGLTWSEPINITPQTKDPKWYLFFNGPGTGITLRDGKIIFAAQYKDENQVPHSTLIYSEDNGQTWHCGTGAKSHTTEAQVVELENGDLMLNMRDDRNRHKYHLSDEFHGRSVAITKDFGKTWTEHPTSRKDLTEPNCMASIISYKAKSGKQYLFFSNPNDAVHRIKTTIKASDDDGETWDKLPQVLLYNYGSFGYSCMSVIDDKYIGILYEGAGDLYFQKIAISEFINE